MNINQYLDDLCQVVKNYTNRVNVQITPFYDHRLIRVRFKDLADRTVVTVLFTKNISEQLAIDIRTEEIWELDFQTVYESLNAQSNSVRLANRIYLAYQSQQCID